MKKISFYAAATLIAATLAVPAFAAAAKKVTVDPACMASAVSARDTAISTALGTVVTALQTRGQALSAAWGNTDPKARQTAVKAANKAFQGTWKTFNTARQAAWTQFKTTAKTCHAASSDVTAPTTADGSM